MMPQRGYFGGYGGSRNGTGPSSTQQFFEDAAAYARLIKPYSYVAGWYGWNSFYANPTFSDPDVLQALLSAEYMAMTPVDDSRVSVIMKPPTRDGLVKRLTELGVTYQATASDLELFLQWLPAVVDKAREARRNGGTPSP